MPNAGADDESAAAYIVYLNGRDAASLASFHVEVLENYGGFVLVSADSRQTARMETAGFAVERVDFRLLLDGWTFDPTTGWPEMPAELPLVSYAEDVDEPYIVQFVGPVKVDWTRAVERAGARLGWYLPNYAFLVRMNPEERAAVEALPFVRWVGEYQPAFRLRPGLTDARGLVDARIVVFQGESANPVIAFLQKLGYGRIGLFDEGPGILRSTQTAKVGAVTARLDASLLPALAHLRQVEYVERYAPPRLVNGDTQWILQTYISQDRRVWDNGVLGAGQVIAVADTGLDFSSRYFRHDSVDWYGAGGADGPDSVYNLTDMTRRKVVRYFPMSNLSSQHRDPFTGGDPWAWQDSAMVGSGTNCTSGHGTAVSGTSLGNDDPTGSRPNDGMAKDAQLFLMDIGTVRGTSRCNNFPDDALAYIPDDFNLLFGPAYDDPLAQVRIHTNSWGVPDQNEYDLMAQMVDRYMWEHPDLLVVFSAGNSGSAEGTVGTPGTNKDGISIGASANPGAEGVISFSSRGPARGGNRIKPDVMASGYVVTACSINDRQTPDIHNCDGNQETGIFGTSFSAPAAAGMAALVRQYYADGFYPFGAANPDEARAPSAALLKATMLASGQKMTGGGATASIDIWPNVAQGWGRINLDSALFFPGDTKGLWVVDNQVGLLTGDTVEYQVNIGGGSVPMKAILAWTDFPGAINADPALVNNLELTVIDPDGVPFKGNIFDVFSQGESARPGDARYPGVYDNTNPNEGVILNPVTYYLRSATNPGITGCSWGNRDLTAVPGSLTQSVTMSSLGNGTSSYCWFSPTATSDTTFQAGDYEIHLWAAANGGAGPNPALVNVQVVEVDGASPSTTVETYCDQSSLPWTALAENVYTCNIGSRVLNAGNRLALRIGKAGDATNYNPVVRVGGPPNAPTNRGDSRLVIPNVKAGVYTIRITAANVPVGPQPFALVVTGNVDLGYGQVFLDQAVYGPASTVTITVEDANAVGPSVDVTISSDFEPLGETVTLSRQGTAARFVGTIQTAIGNRAGGDGILQVADGDTVTVHYADTAPFHDAFAYARIEAAPPVITNVRVTDITNSAATVRWTTDKPATSVVTWADVPNPGTWNTTQTGDLVLYHAVQLDNLTLDTLYYFDVRSTDWFGQSAFDDNGGAHYTFRTIAAADVLLVIGHNTFPDYGLRMYRNALAAYGWSWNEWYADESRQGDPPLSFLQDYKVVIWQVGHDQYPPVEDATRLLLKNYLDGGGRLAVWSHDMGWAFCSDGTVSSRSDWYSAERCLWFRGVMKSQWQADPMTWSRINGIPANPISGSWQSPSGLPYVPFRPQGAAGDEIDVISAGGTAIADWRNNEATADDIAVMWTSSGPNGTVGVGVWGGRPTKFSGNWWEWSRVNPLDENDPTRAAVLNRTIVWLIGHRHPDVNLLSPGQTFPESYSGASVPVTWTATVWAGTIASQEVFYSPNDGQAWVKVANVTPPATTYDWDITGVPNGCGYRMRVVVTDDGGADVPLAGADSSDFAFCIDRPGGDALGPVIWPVSVKTIPNPVARFAMLTLNATADDTLKGNSDIAAVEFFVQPTVPTPPQYGTGTMMNAADGTYDDAVEAATWIGSADFPIGTQQVCVHGIDAAGNWGPFQCTTFFVLTVVAAPAPATNVWAALNGNDVAITWDLSPDDPLNVDHYEVWYGTAYDATGASYALLGTAPSGASLLVQAGAASTVDSYFYVVRAVDLSLTMSSDSATQGAKFFWDLQTGRQLVSSPIALQDASPAAVLQAVTAAGAWTYDANDAVQPWKHWQPGRGGTLTAAGPGRGLWVDATAGDFVVAGQVATNVLVSMKAGWNLVGVADLAGMTVAQLKADIAGSTVLKVHGWSGTAPYYVDALADPTFLPAGSAVWLYLDADGTLAFAN